MILYCVDHDPSGLDMDRDIAERLATLGADVDFQRVALTLEQIDAHDLIPQPTKSADTRSWGYSEDGSWEQDALPVPALVGHVRKAIEELLPEDFHARQAADQADRARLYEVAASSRDQHEDRVLSQPRLPSRRRLDRHRPPIPAGGEVSGLWPHHPLRTRPVAERPRLHHPRRPRSPPARARGVPSVQGPRPWHRVIA